MKFRNVIENDRSTLTKIAVDILEPIYGNQNRAISEWISGQGYKHAYALVSDEDEIMGLLVLKMNPIKTYIKISTFIVVEKYRKHYGVSNMLLDKAFDVLSKSNFLDIIVTISRTREDALIFFIRNGFCLIARQPDKYIKGDTELVFLAIR